MLTIGLTIYGTVALAYGATMILRAPFHDRRDELIDVYDRVLLVTVGLIAIAAWPILVPVYASGWLGNAEARGVYRQIETRRHEAWVQVRRLIAARGTVR